MENTNFYKVPKWLIKSALSLLVTTPLVMALIYPMYCDYIAKSKASEISVFLPNMQKDIEHNLLAGIPISKLDKSKYLKRGKYISFISITDSGDIVAFEESEGTFMIYHPTVTESKVSWICVGQPARDIPLGCNYANSL